MIRPLDGVILGFVEGVTEYLPVSSTGHLILAARALGVSGEGVKAFEVVIQAGAVAAVAGLYRQRMQSMWRGLWGQDATGRRLLAHLVVSFLPAAIAGLALHRWITATLFGVRPVALALAVGGIAMVLSQRWLMARSQAGARGIDSLTPRAALVVGLAQCLSLWPGTSRSMVTILAAMALGLSATSAAEYSFLLALPTLGAATLFDAIHARGVLASEVGAGAVALGFMTAAMVAALSVRGLIRYLTRHGLAPFGWYRIALAAAIWIMV